MRAAKQSGMSLIEVLVAVAISGIVLVVISQTLGNFITTNRHFELKAEELAVKSTIVENLDCNVSMPDEPAVDCATNKILELKNSSSTTIAGSSGGADGTLVGNIRVKAVCTKTALQISTRVDRNPMTNAPGKFSPLFPAGLEPCAALYLPLPNQPPVKCPAGATLVDGVCMNGQVRYIVQIRYIPAPAGSSCSDVGDVISGNCTKNARRCNRVSKRAERICNRMTR